MKKFSVHLLCFSMSLVAIQLTMGQIFIPTQSYQPQYGLVPSYNSVPLYNSVPQYNSVPRYNSVPQHGTIGQYPSQPQYNTVPRYDSVPQHQLQNFQPMRTIVQPVLQPAWTQSLSDPKSKEHNFGVVARASKQSHVFEFENTLGADLILESVRASCGCTKPQILTPLVKPGETAKVDAVFDTLNFFGTRGATITVAMQKIGTTVERGEIQFSVKGDIRRDVVLTPGEVRFDNVRVAEESSLENRSG